MCSRKKRRRATVRKEWKCWVARRESRNRRKAGGQRGGSSGGRRAPQMFCAVMAGMNRTEQEHLYRQSREVIVRASSSGDVLTKEDLVLSVLKSPLHQRARNHRPSVLSLRKSSSVDDPGLAVEERRRLKAATSDEAEDTAPEDPNVSGSRLAFLGQQLRRFRQPRVPRFGEAHHKRVPTPIKKRRGGRYQDEHRPHHHYGRTKSEDLDGDIDDELDDDDDDEEAAVNVVETVPSGKRGSRQPPGVPDPYYPIYLPIDQAFKAKYVFHHKKGKTFQERVYVFLEHPGGWICFIYHFTV
ncbi:hypothetical protein PR048_027596 [Dryococelus australis]|uniref:Uncharacterized protein n=1 Tax=Dryococelus australis TaxID=614101 RepID=A0ABQ9GGZ0_9NEOP|nr:hypothetical protein PR048_027596 [Dryococelus australis]